MLLRIANGVLMLASCILLLGTLSFLVGSGSYSWTDIAAGSEWYFLHQVERFSAFLFGLLGLVGILGALVGVLAIRGRRQFRKNKYRMVESPAAKPLVDPAQAHLRIRRELERTVKRSKATPDQIVDALLGALIDNAAKELIITPAESEVEALLRFDHQLQVVATLTAEKHGQALELLRQMTQIDGLGEGQLEFRSSQRADLLRVSIQGAPGGTQVAISVFEEPLLLDRPVKKQPEAMTSTADGSLVIESTKRRRSPSTVLRLERLRLPDLHSGEWSTPFTGEHDITDSRANILLGGDPSSEREIAPLLGRAAPRPVSPLEAGLRLAFGLLLLTTILLTLGEAYSWGVTRITQGPRTAPWLEIEIVIRSTPREGTVQLQGEILGQTPLKAVVPCKEQKIEVLVKAPGYKAWQWDGFCPQRGPFYLNAQLQPL